MRAPTIPLARQIACVERELRMRAKVYPRWVGLGKISPEKAERERQEMEAVLDTLRAAAAQREPGLL